MMELGEKLRLARQEAGLSQRQLCGDVITRNMLSQIENGTAKPSMATLQYLASRLGKSMGFFLDGAAAASPNQTVMEQARSAYDRADYAGVLNALADYRPEDIVFDRERQLLEARSCLELARQALAEDREGYARELLERAGKLEAEGASRYCPELRYTRLRLQGRLRDADLRTILRELPSLDGDLLLRGEAAFASGDSLSAASFLDAVQDRRNPAWILLRGRVHAARKEFRRAVQLLKTAEKTYPSQVYPELERCYRELGDFKQAYFYACKQKE